MADSMADAPHFLKSKCRNSSIEVCSLGKFLKIKFLGSESITEILKLSF